MATVIEMTVAMSVLWSEAAAVDILPVEHELSYKYLYPDTIPTIHAWIAN